MNTLLMDLFTHYVVPVAGTAIGGLLTWLLAKLHVTLTVDKEKTLRQGLQTALVNAAGLLINKYGAPALSGIIPSDPRMREGIEYVIGGATDALTYFHLINDKTAIAVKIIAKIGLESQQKTSAVITPTYPNEATAPKHR